MPHKKDNAEKEAAAAERAAEADQVAEAPGEAALEPAEAGPVEAETVSAAAYAALESERDALKDRLLRSAADFDNYRKRVARDHEKQRQTAAEHVLRDLLPVMDNLERAVNHGADGAEGLLQGVEMVLSQLRDVLARHGLKPIPALGKPFDPHVHEAIMQGDSTEYAAGCVMMEIQKGYWLGERVLRAAKVAVSTGAPEPIEAETKAEE